MSKLREWLRVLLAAHTAEVNTACACLQSILLTQRSRVNHRRFPRRSHFSVKLATRLCVGLTHSHVPLLTPCILAIACMTSGWPDQQLQPRRQQLAAL
jgi:hypothetical protein